MNLHDISPPSRVPHSPGSYWDQWFNPNAPITARQWDEAGSFTLDDVRRVAVELGRNAEQTALEALDAETRRRTTDAWAEWQRLPPPIRTGPVRPNPWRDFWPPNDDRRREADNVFRRVALAAEDLRYRMQPNRLSDYAVVVSREESEALRYAGAAYGNGFAAEMERVHGVRIVVV